MNEMGETAPANRATKVSLYHMMLLILAIGLALTAFVLAINQIDTNPAFAGYLLLFGVLLLLISTYVLFQARRRMQSINTALSPITTTIECRKCGFKNVREFQRGDYVFKEMEPCQKCNEKMMITAIYKEVKDKEKGRLRI
jgi:multidrug transporter EmrE-like cation transporter